MPKYIFSVTSEDSWRIRYSESKVIAKDGQIIHFDDVEEEKTISGMKADILAKIKNTPLIIEIFYRHKVDDSKLEKIKRANISAIEINLSELSPENVQDNESFWSYINNTQNIKWLYNAKAHKSLYPEIVNRLEMKIAIEEKLYTRREKPKLIRALRDLNFDRSKNRIARYTREAPGHFLWDFYGKYLQISFGELPDFLNVDTPNGDWIFGCDKRIWQTVLYHQYFLRGDIGMELSVNRANSNLRNICKIPASPQIFEMYAKRYPELVPSDILTNMPSSSKTLQSYFTYLCKIGMLTLIPNKKTWEQEDSCYTIISKLPKPVSQN